jgi:hypothetical protein
VGQPYYRILSSVDNYHLLANQNHARLNGKNCKIVYFKQKPLAPCQKLLQLSYPVKSPNKAIFCPKTRANPLPGAKSASKHKSTDTRRQQSKSLKTPEKRDTGDYILANPGCRTNRANEQVGLSSDAGVVDDREGRFCTFRVLRVSMQVDRGGMECRTSEAHLVYEGTGIGVLGFEGKEG